MTAALEGGEWSAARPRPHFTPGKDPGTHFTGGWVGPRGRSGRAENLYDTFSKILKKETYLILVGSHILSHDKHIKL